MNDSTHMGELTTEVTDRDYQLEGIEWLVTKKRAILADEMGMGKTMQAIKAMARFKFTSAIIVCPTSAMVVWLRELQKWLPEGHRYTKFTMIRGDRWTRSQQWKAAFSDPENRFVLTTHDVFKRDIFDKEYNVPYQWDIVIVDEAHKARNRKTKLFEALKHIETKGMFLITGTPASRGPQDVWTLLHLLHPRLFRSYWKFVYGHCHIIQNEFGKEIGGVKDPRGTEAMLSKFMIRRSKEGRMPPKVRNVVPIEMSDFQRKLYNEMTDEMVARLEELPDEELNLEEGMKFWGWDDDDEDEIDGPKQVNDDGEIVKHPSVVVATNHLTMFIRLRQLLICPKILHPEQGDYGAGIEYIIESLQDYDQAERHSVIYTPFAKALPFLRQRLESEGFGPVIELRGGRRADPKAMREKLDLFEQQKGIALCVIKFAQSFDLDSSRRGFFLGYEWDPVENAQAEDRQHRMRYNWTVEMNYLKHEGTVDDRIMQVLNIKHSNVAKFIRTRKDAIALLKGTLQV